MRFSQNTGSAFEAALKYVVEHRQVFITPEHILLRMLYIYSLDEALRLSGCDPDDIASNLQQYIDDYIEVVPEDIEHKPEMSTQLTRIIKQAGEQALCSCAHEINIAHIVAEILKLENCYAADLLIHAIGKDNCAQFLATLVSTSEEEPYDSSDLPDEGFYDDSFAEDDGISKHSDEGTWKQYVNYINDCVDSHNPLIGRQAELDRTIQVLCRCDKNNPLHIGEPGVGKTAIVYGLADRINRDEVPERLKGFKIYELQMGSLVAGTQFRGEMEQRLKSIMDGLASQGNAIVYIDEIHTVIGTGAIGDSPLDTSSILKPYLERGTLRFIGSTTYDEYNRYISRNRGFARRFRLIDITEPSVEDATLILEGLRQRYEEYHGVTFASGVIAHTVKTASRYITDRRLPDSAIDIIDEAGAYRQTHPTYNQIVDNQLIDSIIAKACKVETLAETTDDDTAILATLRDRMRSQVYGQDSAIDTVVEAIYTTRAGLSDDDKPQASLLFVGPTGVGKTEIARVLATELGVPLRRFDMSEYSEKHSVAKLIGSPAGYVGYEDGGLLTDAIRKTPRCVLLLDEIEKAHDSIFDTLLQVMDYAALTDNRGNRIDFRHVVLIMTSNAGAQFAHLASVGFGSQARPSDAMLKEVRRRFKPEFINRLSSTVIFNDMTSDMARLILDKRIRQLSARLASRNISLSLSPEATEWILANGFSPRYGARELDRVINSSLKPLIVHDILFGKLRNGGTATISVVDNSLKLDD